MSAVLGESQSRKRRLTVRRAVAWRWMPVVLCLVGLLLLAVSWRLRTDPWWPGVLTEAGVAVLLFAPLLLVGRGIEHTLDAVRKAQRHTEEQQQELAEHQRRTESEVAQLAQEVAEAQAAVRRLSSEQLSDAVLNRIVEEREKDAALFASVAESPTWAAVLDSLMRARELELIPASGCRVSLFGVDCYLRFRPEWTGPQGPLYEDDEPDAIRLTLEFTDGTERKTITWEKTQTPTEIVIQVVEAMQSLGCYPGDKLFKAGRIFAELGELLQSGHKLATSGTVYPVRHIVQFCPPQWVIADDGIYSIQPGAHYSISASRFHEQDWNSHMREKSWLNEDSFDDAFSTAQLLQQQKSKLANDPWSDSPPF